MNQILAVLTDYWSALVDYFAFDTSLLAEPSIIGRLILQLVLLLASAIQT